MAPASVSAVRKEGWACSIKCARCPIIIKTEGTVYFIVNGQSYCSHCFEDLVEAVVRVYEEEV